MQELITALKERDAAIESLNASLEKLGDFFDAHKDPLAQIQADYNEDVEVTEMETKDALKWLKHDCMAAVCYDCGKNFWKEEKSDELCGFCSSLKSDTDYSNQPNQ